MHWRKSDVMASISASKYRSSKLTVDGVTFDSRKEYFRWNELSLLERAGVISGLQRQVRFELPLLLCDFQSWICEAEPKEPPAMQVRDEGFTPHEVLPPIECRVSKLTDLKEAKRNGSKKRRVQPF
jgi:hypothetical protein